MTKSCGIQWLKNAAIHIQLTFKFLKNLGKVENIQNYSNRKIDLRHTFS
jgi:hypothetical protein